MLEDGSFERFLQMWSDRFPQEGKLTRIRRCKEENRCSLKEAKLIIDSERPEAVEFEIGSDRLLRKENGRFTLLAKVKGIWTVCADSITLEKVAEPGFLLKQPEREVERICSSRLIHAGRHAALHSLARQIAMMMRERRWWTTHFLFCEDEIWRTDRLVRNIIHADSDCGMETFPFTVEGIKAHLERRFKAMDTVRGAF